jgi:hypothetical protein
LKIILVVTLILIFGSIFVFSESYAQEEWETFRIAGEFYLSNGKTDYQIQEIPYKISNGTINTIESKRSSNIILIAIDPVKQGKLEIKIPRNIIDATIGKEMDDFFILLDKKEIDFEEKKLYDIEALCYRELEIVFSKGNSFIEIIGVTAGMQSLNVYPFYPIECLSNPPPKLQVKSGIAPEEVICNDDLALVIKSSNGSPACVTESSSDKLLQRGWASQKIGTKSKSQFLQYSPVLFKGTGVSLEDEKFSENDLMRLDFLAKDLERLLEDPDLKREDRKEYSEKLEMIQLYAQQAFDEGISWELIEILWEKDKELSELFSQVDRNRFPITSVGGISIGVNAYSLDEKVVGKPIALKVDILKEKFSKNILTKTDKMIREQLGDEVDIIYSKGSFVYPVR